MGRRKQRHWSDEDNREICAQTTLPDVSVARVARRYAVNASLIFKWLKDPRFAPQVVEAETIPAFLPVQISNAADEPLSPAPQSPPPAVPRAGGGVSLGSIEIELSGGHRLRMDGDADPDALARLLKAILS